MTMLTEKRLLAIREALNAKLSGSLDDTTIDRKTYQDALEWARGKLRDKQQRKEYTSEAQRLRTGLPR